jgi:heat shock protein HslJ
MKRKIAILLSVLMVLTVSTFAQNQLKGEWTLVSMTDENGSEISLPQKYGMGINFVSPAVYIRSCNSMSGKYSAGKRNIKFTKIITTLKACPEAEKENAYSSLLRSANVYSVKKGELILSAKNSKSVLMFKRKTNEKMVGLNGKWQLVSMKSGKSLPMELPAKPITLNIDKDKIGGNGGCNSYGGSLLQTAKIVKFFEIFSTKMYCEGSSPTESKYFAALEKSVNFELKDDELILTDAKRENKLVFSPAD